MKHQNKSLSIQNEILMMRNKILEKDQFSNIKKLTDPWQNVIMLLKSLSWVVVDRSKIAHMICQVSMHKVEEIGFTAESVKKTHTLMKTKKPPYLECIKKVSVLPLFSENWTSQNLRTQSLRFWSNQNQELLSSRLKKSSKPK